MMSYRGQILEVPVPNSTFGLQTIANPFHGVEASLVETYQPNLMKYPVTRTQISRKLNNNKISYKFQSQRFQSQIELIVYRLLKINFAELRIVKLRHTDQIDWNIQESVQYLWFSLDHGRHLDPQKHSSNGPTLKVCLVWYLLQN